MAVIIRGRSTSRVTTELVHESGSVIRTMAPRDNGGDGSDFSPTDLFAASLGACATSIMSMFATDKGIPYRSIEFELIKEMSGPPRKVARLAVVFRIDTDCSDVDFGKIVAAGKTCPVRITLGDVVEVVERYERSGAR